MVVVLTPAGQRGVIVLLPVVEQVVVETHRETAGHDHIVALQGGQVVKTLLAEVIVGDTRIAPGRVVVVDTVDGRLELLRMGLDDLGETLLGDGAGRLRIFDTGGEGEAQGEDGKDDSYFLHIRT